MTFARRPTASISVASWRWHNERLFNLRCHTQLSWGDATPMTMSAIYTGPMTYWTTGARILKRLPRLLNSRHAATIDTTSYNYLGNGDRALIKDALFSAAIPFLLWRTSFPKMPITFRAHLAFGVLSSLDMWELLRPWAARFL